MKMEHTQDVVKVKLINADGKTVGSAEGPELIRLLLADFAERGEGKTLVFCANKDDERDFCLAMSHGGDLQLGQEKEFFA